MVIVEENLFVQQLWRIEFPMDISIVNCVWTGKIEFSTLFAAMIRRPEVIFALHFRKYWFISVWS